NGGVASGTHSGVSHTSPINQRMTRYQPTTTMSRSITQAMARGANPASAAVEIPTAAVGAVSLTVPRSGRVGVAAAAGALRNTGSGAGVEVATGVRSGAATGATTSGFASGGGDAAGAGRPAMSK